MLATSPPSCPPGGLLPLEQGAARGRQRSAVVQSKASKVALNPCASLRSWSIDWRCSRATMLACTPRMPARMSKPKDLGNLRSFSITCAKPPCPRDGQQAKIRAAGKSQGHERACAPGCQSWPATRYLATDTQPGASRIARSPRQLSPRALLGSFVSPSPRPSAPLSLCLSVSLSELPPSPPPPTPLSSLFPFPMSLSCNAPAVRIRQRNMPCVWGFSTPTCAPLCA